MKKLFIAVLALAALASCQKENEVTILETSQKSVMLSIANSNQATRIDPTAASQATNFDCAAAADLTVLFADQAGKVVETRALTAGDNVEGVYTFHKLPETVQQIGVIALRGNSQPATLSAAETIWKTETVAAEVKDIVVYGASGQMKQNGTCEVDGANYPLFEGKVEVRPYHTRLEVTGISCDDLGGNEYGYSKIELTKLTYTGEDDVYTLTNVLTPEAQEATAGENKVWAWNWAPEKDAANLVIDMTVTGKNYTVAVPNKTLTVTGYNDAKGNPITKFEQCNVYKLNIPFLEENIDATDNYICVKAEVIIGQWTVNTITPVFGNN